MLGQARHFALEWNVSHASEYPHAFKQQLHVKPRGVRSAGHPHMSVTHCFHALNCGKFSFSKPEEQTLKRTR